MKPITRVDIKNLTKDFKKLVGDGNLFHAYLFFGEETDKIFGFAKELANFLETREFKETGHFLNDFLAISPNEFNNIGIDEIRELQNFLYQTPVISRRRVAVINGADLLTDDSEGAILKIIEEPPKKSLVILVARQEDSLLPTIRSRVHKIYFPAEPDFFKTRDEIGDELTKENLDRIFKNSLIDFSVDLRQNFEAAKEVLSRLALIKSYNLNNRLQLRLLNFYFKKKQILKKPVYGRKTKRGSSKG